MESRQAWSTRARWAARRSIGTSLEHELAEQVNDSSPGAVPGNTPTFVGASVDNTVLQCLCSILGNRRTTLNLPDPQTSACATASGGRVMRLAQIVVAAAILFPAVSSLAQSTPPALNEDVRAQLVQEKAVYTSLDANDQKRASMSSVNRNESPSRQITGMNMGRYSMTVVAPSLPR